MAKKIGLGLLVIIVIALIYVATRPADFRIERSAQISAPPDVVFSIINDFSRSQEWSPYEKLDPNLKKTFDGPQAGPGASYSWTGNDAVGAGRLTLLESKPNDLVSMKLEMLKPFPCTNHVTFKLVPSEEGTKVTWSMDGKNDFMAKAVSMFMDIDGMVGKQFEEGLANLNQLAQAENRKLKQHEN